MDHRILTFGLCAPAGFSTDPAAIERAQLRLEQLGHRVSVDPLVSERWQRFSGTDDARLGVIDRITDDPAIDVALTVRGGYGWTRLLDRIDFARLRASGKRWMGHSDFTAFALAALARAQMVTYAGPMAAYDFGAEQPSAFTFEHCFGVLNHPTWVIECPLEGPPRFACNGTLWGGNLALVVHLCGTPYFPDVPGGILFLEDVAEAPYSVERMLYQLFHAGVLARQRAVLLGSFTEYQLTENDGGYDLAAVVAQLRAKVGVPIYTGLPFGHVRDKLTLPVGGRASIETRDGAARLVLSDYRA